MPTVSHDRKASQSRGASSPWQNQVRYLEYSLRSFQKIQALQINRIGGSAEHEAPLPAVQSCVAASDNLLFCLYPKRCNGMLAKTHSLIRDHLLGVWKNHAATARHLSEMSHQTIPGVQVQPGKRIAAASYRGIN
ncbi:hypothetical protein D3C78_1284440 [compost metagenome]